MTESKKIAFITNNAGYTPESAMGIYTWLLACKLAKRGFTIYYYCRGSYIDHSTIPDNVHLIIFPSKTYWSAVVKSIKKEKIKVALYHYLSTVWGWNGIPVKPPFYVSILKFNGVKVVTNFHETVIRWNFTKPWLSAQAITQRIAAFIMLKYSSSVISSVDSYVKYLRKYNKSVFKIPIATNILPVDAEIYDDNYKLQLKQTLRGNGEILIACFGNRDYSVLISNLSELIKLDYKIKTIIIGHISDIHMKNMSTLINDLNFNDNVIFTGLVSQDEVYNNLSVSDIIFAFEKVENGNEGGASFKSGSLVASFSMGVPIISTKGDLNDDNFKSEVPIFLFHPNESNTLLPIIKELIDKPVKRKDIAAKTKFFYDTYLSWDQIVDKYVYIFDAL